MLEGVEASGGTEIPWGTWRFLADAAVDARADARADALGWIRRESQWTWHEEGGGGNVNWYFEKWMFREADVFPRFEYANEYANERSA